MVSSKKGNSKKYCYICKEVVTVNNSIQSLKEHHEEEHREVIENVKKSNSMEDCVKSACKICGIIVKVTAMRGHTKSAHKMSISEYKEKYNQTYFDLVELVLHQCGICEEYVLLDSDYIAQHLKSGGGFHDITHGNYNAKFMKLINTASSPYHNLNHKNITEKKYSTGDELKSESEKKTRKKEKKVSEKSTQNSKSTSLVESLEKSVSSIDALEETTDKGQSKFDAAVNALNDEIDNTLKSFSKNPENETKEVENITVESFRALLDSLSIDGEEIRFPALESLLNLDI